MLLSRSSFKISKLKNVAYHIEYQILYKGKIFKHCSFLHEVNKLLKYVQVLDHGWPLAASSGLRPLRPHILNSNDLRLGWPRATSSDLGISNSLYSLKKGLMETGVQKDSAT